MPCSTLHDGRLPLAADAKLVSAADANLKVVDFHARQFGLHVDTISILPDIECGISWRPKAGAIAKAEPADQAVHIPAEAGHFSQGVAAPTAGPKRLKKFAS